MFLFVFSLNTFAAQVLTEASPESRVASVFVSEDFINEQLAAHAKSELMQDLKVSLDPNKDQIFLRGKVQVPVEELKAVNLDPKLGLFKFQLTIKLSATKEGHLILDFPLEETFFYPADSTDPLHDRVIVPVQMISLALASARGYLSALSGDFTVFDRREKKLLALKKAIENEIKHEKNQDALEDLKSQKQELKIQLEALPIERKQMEHASKAYEHILGFTGEKELNLNDELGALKNALILKIRLAQLTPYLDGVDIGAIRIVRDKKDGNGENYFVVDINSQLAIPAPPPLQRKPSDRQGMKVAPAMIVRLDQTLFESKTLVDMEKKQMGSKLEDFTMELRDDGLHVSGKFHKWFFIVPFDTTVDFVSTGLDVFELRVRELDVGGINFEFLTGFVLEAMQNRLDKALKGMCTFKYVGKEADKSRSLQVTMDPKKLVPAFPGLHIVDVDVREREFLLKIGHGL